MKAAVYGPPSIRAAIYGRVSTIRLISSMVSCLVMTLSHCPCSPRFPRSPFLMAIGIRGEFLGAVVSK